MSAEPILRFYLPDALRAKAALGEHNFIAQIVGAVRSEGFETEFLSNSKEERAKAPHREGYAIFHMQEPTHDAALSIRRAYFYPFWQIEKMANRWDYRVANTRFDPESQTQKVAQDFVKRLRNRLFYDASYPQDPQGFIYAPLQGRLLDHRAFQMCSPIEMLQKTLRAMPDHPIIATLHPSETYSKAELSALNVLAARNPRLTIGDKPALEYLTACDFVVTQNSSLALTGFIFQKRCVLFARIDFHHIAASAYKLGPKEAFAQVKDASPNFDSYLYWFLQKMTVNAGHASARQKILETLRRFEWRI